MRLAECLPYHPGEDVEGKLESRPAVFALFFSGEEPPYLSRSRDLRRRLGRLLGEASFRSKLLNLRSITQRIEFQYVGSDFEARWFLYLLNRSHYPRLYRQRLRLKPPAFLKINLRNRFPRCYPTRRIVSDGSLYYGPFPNHRVAERFSATFLDLFKIRRCTEELHPDPTHPGCIYSQMKMCLAPCFMGCTDEEYHQELGRVIDFLDAEGRSLLDCLSRERDQASQALEFESAERSHKRIEKVNEILRGRPNLVRNLNQLEALLVFPGATPRTVTFFRLKETTLRGPATLRLEENIPSPEPLDRQLENIVNSLAEDANRPQDSTSLQASDSYPVGSPARGQAWEPLTLVSRWYYSGHPQGELIMLSPNAPLPHRRLTRLCRNIIQQGSVSPPESSDSTSHRP